MIRMERTDQELVRIEKANRISRNKGVIRLMKNVPLQY